MPKDNIFTGTLSSAPVGAPTPRSDRYIRDESPYDDGGFLVPLERRLDTQDLHFYRSLTESASVAIYLADANGRLTYANPKYRDVFGLSPHQSLEDWAQGVHPIDRERMQAAWADFCRCPQAVQFEWRALSREGKVRCMTESVARTSVDGIDGFAGYITDVTDLKAALERMEGFHRDPINALSSYPDDPVAVARARLEVELRDALQLGQLELHYQPKVDMQTGAVHSAEALIRWRHPQRGLVPPMHFIPLAEETGLIGEIGEWVVNEACRQNRAWQDEGLPPVRIAVNLAPSQFRHGNLLAIMRHALEEARLDPRFLEVELTESTVMSDGEASVVILKQLSQMGVLVSIDDFGTGYSSMSYLRRFPIDKLKIDRTFIHEIVSRPDDASIVKAIISLAHSLKLKVVAEGVETQAQLDFLKAFGCDQYQGYYFSPAVPAKDFPALLRGKGPTHFMDHEAQRTHSKLAAYRR